MGYFSESLQVFGQNPLSSTLGRHSYAMVLTTADPQSKQPGLMCCVCTDFKTQAPSCCYLQDDAFQKPFIITLSLI